MIMKLEIDAAEEAFLRSYGHARPGVRAAMKAALEAATHMRGEIAKLDAWIDTLNDAPMGA